MDMETSLAYSPPRLPPSLPRAFSPSPPCPAFRVCRRFTSTAHAAFVQPGGLSFGARGFLSFGAPSLSIFFGGIVVEEKRRSCNCGENWRGKWVYAAHFGGKRNKCGELPFL
jgi:hypothetical protein